MKKENMYVSKFFLHSCTHAFSQKQYLTTKEKSIYLDNLSKIDLHIPIAKKSNRVFYGVNYNRTNDFVL